MKLVTYFALTYDSGSFRSTSMIDSFDMSLGSLRHSSMQGMPSLVAMTPDIEQKLVRTRTSDLSPDTTGITNKVRNYKISIYLISLFDIYTFHLI